MLANRHRLDMISEGLTARVETLLPSFPSEQLRGDIEQAKVLTLFGADLHLTLMRNYAPLFDKLQGGDTVGVLLINPDSHACEMAANLHVQPMTCDDKRRTIRRSLKLCAELKNKTGGSIEVRLVDHLPAFGAFAMDQESPDGVLYFWHYTYKARDEARPKMILHPGDGYWYRFFCGEVRRIWEDAEPWQSSEAASGS